MNLNNKGDNNMKKIICGIAIMLTLMGASRLDKTLLLTMDVIDTVGYTFNISTIEYIDKLNEIYYNLGYK